jgi:RNA polymerase sigma factor (TIGR02999 family)
MQETVTGLLAGWAGGDQAAADRLFALVYGELRALARGQRRRWRGDHTLDTTALVHEAYLKLAGRDGAGGLDVRGRAHFYAIAARAMRQILANYSRARRARKRGGGAAEVTLDGLSGALPLDGGIAGVALTPEHADAVAALDEALTRLEAVSPRQCRVVECRFYGGLSIPDTAAALDVSEATIKRDWAVAQAWLYRELRGHAPDV